MPNQYRSATIRALIAAVIVAAWVIWYDGPPWAWAVLVVYAVFTFGVAYFITGKNEEQRKREQTMDRAFGDDE